MIVYLKEDRRFADIRRISVARQLNQPEDPMAFIDFIEACASAGDLTERDAGEAEFLSRFGKNHRAMLELGEYAGRSGRVEIAEKVLAECREARQHRATAALWLISALTSSGNPAEALKRADALAKEDLDWSEYEKVYFEGAKIVALYRAGKEVEAEPGVGKLLESRYLRAPMAASLAFKLQAMGQVEPARRLLLRAVDLDALDQQALVGLLRLEIGAGRLMEVLPLVERLPAMRKPPADLMDFLRKTFESDRYLYLPERLALLEKLSHRQAKS